jgi:ribosome-binding protein aMBF1 (putative translation factor)
MSKWNDYRPNSRPQTASERPQTADRRRQKMSPPRKQPDTSTYTGRFAVHIRNLRLKAGLSVEELAEQSGIPKTSLYNWESATFSPILEQLPDLAAGLGLKDIRKVLPKE